MVSLIRSRILLTCIACLSCYSVHLLLRSAGVVGKIQHSEEEKLKIAAWTRRSCDSEPPRVLLLPALFFCSVLVLTVFLTSRVSPPRRDPGLRAARPQSLRTHGEDISRRHHHAAQHWRWGDFLLLKFAHESVHGFALLDQKAHLMKDYTFQRKNIWTTLKKKKKLFDKEF